MVLVGWKRNVKAEKSQFILAHRCLTFKNGRPFGQYLVNVDRLAHPCHLSSGGGVFSEYDCICDICLGRSVNLAT